MRVLFLRLIFGFAAIYDFAIGAWVIFAGAQMFEVTHIPAPQHWGYVQFCALLLMTFGLMFTAVAIDPVQHRNLIPFGALLKASYCGVVGYYWIWELKLRGINAGTVENPLPDIFKWFVYADALMFFIFCLAYRQLRRIAISYPKEVMVQRA
jgi:hypothetical protein